MAAPEGNEYWKLRTKHGRDALFASGSLLRDACFEYFQWCIDNPLMEEKVGWYEGSVCTHDTAKLRPYTLGGLMVYLKINRITWADWRKNEDLSAVCEEIDEMIREQKFAGATAGLMNPAIIARDLGLADKSELQNLDKNGAPADPVGPNVYLSAALEAVKKSETNG